LPSAALAEEHLRAAFGARIREARKQRNLTGQRLAELAGITPSFVSQIELGQVTPSISTVFRLIEVLDVTVGDLFDAQRPSTGRVLEPEDWEIFQMPDGTDGRDAVLGVDANRRLEALWSSFPPGARTDEVAHTADVLFVFVLKGQIELHVRDTVHRLRERASITLDGRLPHAWANTSDEVAEILSVVTPAL
jgi:transcriptional regulator with XRE-family HTH domain